MKHLLKLMMLLCAVCISVSSGGHELSDVRSSEEDNFFEGALLYRNYEFHSALVRKFSSGQAYNGERTVQVTIKGPDIHIFDRSMQVHTILKPKENKVYFYSDAIRRGFETDFNYVVKYMSAYDPDVETAGMAKTSTLKNTDELVEYKGDVCRKYKGQLKTGDASSVDVELWFSPEYDVYKSYWYTVSGLQPAGIIKKGIYSQSGKIPLLGEMKSTVAMELVAIKAYEVPEAEMLPPEDYIMEKFEKNSQILSFYKDNKTVLKKSNQYPESMDKDEVKYNIQNEWDFATSWIQKKFVPEKETVTWAKVGMYLFNTTMTIMEQSGAAAVQEPVESDPESVSGSGAGKAGHYQLRYNELESKVRSESDGYGLTNSKTAPATKRLIRTYQKAMKQARDLAAKEGVVIKKSVWETWQP